MVPLPVKPESVPPVATTSLASKSVLASDRVKVMVEVLLPWPLPTVVGVALMAMVGAVVSGPGLSDSVIVFPLTAVLPPWLVPDTSTVLPAVKVPVLSTMRAVRSGLVPVVLPAAFTKRTRFEGARYKADPSLSVPMSIQLLPPLVEYWYLPRLVCWTLLPALVMDCFGPRAVSAILGTLYTGAALGNLGGPWLAGAVFDAQGSYTPVILACLALSALATAASMRLLPPRRAGAAAQGGSGTAA